MSLKISEKNRPRFTLVVILLIFVSITAYSLNNVESKQKITVDEGYGEISVEYYNPENITDGVGGRDYFNKSVNTTTNINEESKLGLKVNLRSCLVSVHDNLNYGIQTFNINIECHGNLTDSLNPDKMVLKAESVGNYSVSSLPYFLTSHTFIDNGSVAENYHTNKETLKLNSQIFQSKGLLCIDVEQEEWGNPYTIEIQAELKGLTEDVTATVDLHIQGGIE